VVDKERNDWLVQAVCSKGDCRQPSSSRTRLEAIGGFNPAPLVAMPRAGRSSFLRDVNSLLAAQPGPPYWGRAQHLTDDREAAGRRARPRSGRMRLAVRPTSVNDEMRKVTGEPPEERGPAKKKKSEESPKPPRARGGRDEAGLRSARDLPTGPGCPALRSGAKHTLGDRPSPPMAAAVRALGVPNGLM